MVSEEFSLSGKNALVAAYGRFWAKPVAAALAEAGADVAVAAKSPKKLEEAVGEVKRLGRKAVAISTDVTQSSQVSKMVEQAVAELGGIDILVNAFDLEFAKPLMEVTEDEWHRVVDINLTSVFRCCQAVGKHMLPRKKGRIINVISCLSERGVANYTAYSAAMGGVLQLTKTLALEWALEGITVNGVGTGWFAEADTTGVEGESLLLRFLPMKRYGHPREIGSLVVYLASDTTDFVTGMFMTVDGAAMAHP